VEPNGASRRRFPELPEDFVEEAVGLFADFGRETVIAIRVDNVEVFFGVVEAVDGPDFFGDVIDAAPFEVGVA
jgi:hypothetical protein